MYDKENLSQASKDLLAMSDEIEQDGWCQGIMEDSLGRVCIMGAAKKIGIHPIPGYTPFDINTWHPTLQLIYSHLRMRPWSWNDRIAKTKEQVVGMLRNLAFNGGK